MPRGATLTGRIERARRRQIAHLRRSLFEIVRTDGISEFRDAYKAALNIIPRNFEPFSIGPMNMRCMHCSAKHFKSETTLKDTNAFYLCCHKGKVVLPPLTQNSFFENICKGLSSSNILIKKRSKNYFQNIRSFNSSFAMVSSEANLCENHLNGVYHFKIHDIFYHRAGAYSTNCDRPPTYAQLYFYDVETANQFRMGMPANNGCDEALLNELANELYRVNPFINSFKTLSEYCQRPENVASNISMAITVNRNTDLRRFNDAIHTDIAAIFRSDEGEPPFDRNMIVFSKDSNTLRTVSVLDSSLDPLAYPLLFPNGDTGWHINIEHSTFSTASRNKVTMLQYASYRLSIRDQFSLLHVSQKLYLQWIVDMYCRIEGTRLHFIRQNQQVIRSEVYNNLTDFLQQHPNGADETHSVGRKIILPSSFIGAPRTT